MTAIFNQPSSVGEQQLENIEREVDCTEEEIKIAKRHGMAAWHLEGLRLYCWQENRMLILRSSKYESRRFHFSGDHKAKSAEVKAQTMRGEVVFNGQRYFSDYDMLSLWDREGNSYERVATCLPNMGFKKIDEVINKLNMFIGNRIMFQHGANDEYVDEKGLPKNSLKDDETFIAFDERRNIIELMSLSALRNFYNQRSLDPWIY